MIKKEHYMTREDGVELYRTFSDTGYYIRQVQTGVVYNDAVDVESAPYTYEETDEVIIAEELEESQEKIDEQ